MELIGHFLWTNLFSNYFLKKYKKEVNNKETIFWGIFPDLISFGPLFFILVLNYFKVFNFNYYFSFNLISFLYNFSHSFIFYFLCFFVIFFIKKKFYLESLGWFFHIFIDIFTHSKNFYPTKFLWPLSDFGFNGISWRNIYFLVFNYFVLLVVYGLIYIKKGQNKKIFKDYVSI